MSPVNASFGEVTPLKNGFTRSQIAGAISPRSLNLILLPTEKCNFRCTYCYEDYILGKMSNDIQSGLMRLIDRRIAELELLTFSWFGGEPLLARDVVLRISRYAHEICKANGVEFRGGLTTNAYLLTEDLARNLLECNQDFYQITLDGWGEGHDALRRYANGRGTFDVIWKNLCELRKIRAPFEVVIRVHVRRDNFDNLKVLMRNVAQSFGADQRFRVDFQRLRDMGGAGGRTVETVAESEMPMLEHELRSEFYSNCDDHNGLPVRPPAPQPNSTVAVAFPKLPKSESASSQRSNDQSAAAPYICYAAKPNSLLVRANGRIGKCTVILDDLRNDIGHLRSDGTIQIDNTKLRPWIKGLSDLEPEQLGCPAGWLNR